MTPAQQSLVEGLIQREYKLLAARLNAIPPPLTEPVIMGVVAAVLGSLANRSADPQHAIATVASIASIFVHSLAPAAAT